MADFYFASVNEDGTYGELKKIDGVVDITPVLDSAMDAEDTVYPTPFITSGMTFTFEFEMPFELQIYFWYIRQKDEKSCLTCRNCMEMYRYPGFVTAEECECLQGLECDTILHSVKNCPKWDYKPYSEPRRRNPDLDKYPYVVKGE